eukprot:5447597-Pyramimonas_sp.AAC.1
MWLSAAHIRLGFLQELHGLRAGCFQNVALALAPAHSFCTFARVARIECGFPNVALALAPRTFLAQNRK